MPNREEVIGTAALAKEAADSRVDLAWQKAEAWMGKVKIRKPSKPDFDAITAAMAKAKKGMDFVAKFDGQWLTIASRIGGKDSSIAEIDISEGKNEDKWRTAMDQLREGSPTLVPTSDYTAFEKAHPDLKALAPWKLELDKRNAEIKKLEAELVQKKAQRDKIKATYEARGGK